MHRVLSASVLKAEAAPAVVLDVVAGFSVRLDAPDVRHEDARLARHVRAVVPRRRLCVERRVCHLVRVAHPLLLRLCDRLDRAVALGAHRLHDPRDDVDVVLGREDHLALDGRALRAGDEVHVREARHHQAEVRARPGLPLVGEGEPVRVADVDAARGARYRVEASREDEVVDRVPLVAHSHAVGVDAADRRLLDADEGHVVPVVRLVVVCVEAEPLGSDRVVGRHQQVRHRWLDQLLSDALPHEAGGGLVGVGALEQVIVREEHRLPAHFPARLVSALPLLVAHLERRDGGRAVLCDPERRDQRLLPDLAVACLVGRLRLGFQRRVPCRNRVVRRPLKDSQVRGGPRHLRDDLHAGRARADHADPAAGEVDSVARPEPGVEGAAREALHARDVGQLRRRQVPRREDEVRRDGAGARVGLHRPAARVGVVGGTRHASVEGDAAAQVEAVGYVVGVPLELLLRRIDLAPLPVLLERLVKRV
mmetsp:Transcript_29507/g.94416  ORF Transcript_29507/g.94416 Transcript_29507/m.94416 type:complete len:480 (-) Transcript_29507:287-1726(-)